MLARITVKIARQNNGSCEAALRHTLLIGTYSLTCWTRMDLGTLIQHP